MISPVIVNSAEILQITNSNTILIGDQNRNLQVKLFCINVEKDNETKAINILKKKFPRGTKVKIKPFGLKEVNLLAKIYSLKDDIEMTDLLITNKLSDNTCY